MAITNTELLAYLNNLLQPEKVRDYCPNGLQVEGKSQINRIITGVTATQALIDRAVELNADAIFVHHGYFWKGEDPCVRGMKKARFKALLENDLNLFAYHLPLDIHPQLGNNAQLARVFGLTVDGGLEEGNSQSVAVKGHFAEQQSLSRVASMIEAQLGRSPLVESSGPDVIKTVAWCTGGGQGYIDMAANQDIDLFISGEVSEQTIHVAREMKINFIAAGHHATERYGAKAVGEHLQRELGVEVLFEDIDNPA